MSIWGNPVMIGGRNGGILHGADAPAANLGEDGDGYVRKMPIPSNVNFVEYLQSSGTQYIQTSIIADQNTDAVCDFTAVSLASTSETGRVFGSRTDASNRAFFFAYYYSTASGNRGWRATIAKRNGNADDLLVSVTAGQRYVYALKTAYLSSSANYSILTNNGNVAGMRTSGSAFTTPSGIVIFGIYNGGSISKEPVILHRLTFYQAYSPIADYLPCLDPNGIACLWENIAGEYVYNAGAGDFAYGGSVSPAELDPVLYIKRNGVWEVAG